tara:strand:- start:62 stop:361 length:300 start_codon:yes stop_codon:yes gene_type:complete
MDNPVMLNGQGIHVCPECQAISTAESPRQPDNGLDIRISGGYGMFIDDWDSEFDETFCHDCAVKLAKLFPNTIGKYVQRGHPVDRDNKRCCEFAWGFED